MTNTNSSSATSTIELSLDSPAMLEHILDQVQFQMDADFADYLDENAFYIKGDDKFNLDDVFEGKEASGFTEAQVEALCLLETKRQEKALEALKSEYFSSSN